MTPGFEFDEFRLSLGLNQLYFLLLLYLRTVTVLFQQQGCQDADVEMTANCKVHINLYRQYFASHVNPRWQSVGKDADDIFHMLEEVEAGADWKGVWKRLRGY